MQLELTELDLRFAALRIIDRARVRWLVASICERGQQTPVLVVRGEASGFVLIDGYARVEAVRRLGLDVVEAAVLEMAEAEALVVGYRLDNGRQRSALEEGWMLRELCDCYGLSLETLARKLDRSRSWVSRRLALVRALPPSVQEVVQQGKMSVQVATKYLVPLARANAEQCERLVAGLAGARVSVREMERLYAAWRKGDRTQRERLCAEPKLFLQADAAIRADARSEPSEELQAIAKDLRIIAGVCSRARGRLERIELTLVGERQRRTIRGAFERAREGFGSLCARLEGVDN